MFKKRNISTANASKKKVLKPLSESEDESDDDSGNVVKQDSSKFKKFRPNVTTDKKQITGQVDYDSSKKESLSLSTEATKQDRLLAEDEEAYRVSASTKPDVKNEDEGTYKGQKSYVDFSNSKPKSATGVGPMKTASHIRSTTTFDFQPDVCKDYKQTGYCGYGDTCKFLHLRDDIKKGWKINKEWESVGKSKFKDEKLEKIPFKCPICKDDYKNPIITPCQHYFCQACYLKQYRKTKSCFICGKNSGGSMVIAKDLKKLLQENKDS